MPRTLVIIPSVDTDATAFIAVAPEGMTIAEAEPEARRIVESTKDGVGEYEQFQIEEAFEAAGWEVWPHVTCEEAI